MGRVMPNGKLFVSEKRQQEHTLHYVLDTMLMIDVADVV